MTTDYRQGRSRTNYRIRGTRQTQDVPHKACPSCYADCTSSDAGPLVEYRCPRGHQFTGYRSDGLNHATYLARYQTGIEQNR